MIFFTVSLRVKTFDITISNVNTAPKRKLLLDRYLSGISKNGKTRGLASAPNSTLRLWSNSLPHGSFSNSLWSMKRNLTINSTGNPIKQSIYSPAVSELTNTCPKWHIQNISKTEWIRVFSIVCSSSSQLSICLFFFFPTSALFKILPSCWYLIIKQLFSSVSVIDCLVRNLS